MKQKPKPPPAKAQPPAPTTSRQPLPNALRQNDSRWQRTVRYGWDKGGSKGGR